MSDRASLPDFELPVTGTPPFPLSAPQANPHAFVPRQGLSPGRAVALPSFNHHVPH